MKTGQSRLPYLHFRANLCSYVRSTAPSTWRTAFLAASSTPKAVIEGKVRVKSPPETPVELVRAVNI